MATRNTNDIPMPLGTRLMRVVRVSDGWIAWTATRDYMSGTMLRLGDDGSAHRVTVRAGEGDDVVTIRPADTQAETQRGTKQERNVG